MGLLSDLISHNHIITYRTRPSMILHKLVIVNNDKVVCNNFVNIEINFLWLKLY